jgi:hypothetical protein
MAIIVPFPTVRRAKWIGRRARVLSTYNHKAADRAVAEAVADLRDRLTRFGVAPSVIGDEIRTLELLLRGRLAFERARRGGRSA